MNVLDDPSPEFDGTSATETSSIPLVTPVSRSASRKMRCWIWSTESTVSVCEYARRMLS